MAQSKLLDIIALRKFEVPYTKSLYSFCTKIILYVNKGDSWGGVHYHPKGIICTNLVEAY